MEKSKAPIHKQANVSKGLIFLRRPVNHSLGVIDLPIDLLHCISLVYFMRTRVGDFSVKGECHNGQKPTVWGLVLDQSCSLASICHISQPHITHPRRHLASSPPAAGEPFACSYLTLLADVPARWSPYSLNSRSLPSPST